MLADGSMLIHAASTLYRMLEGKGLHVYAAGIRNCSGLTVQPATGALWCAVNERDGLGDDLPPDFATRVVDDPRAAAPVPARAGALLPPATGNRRCARVRQALAVLDR